MMETAFRMTLSSDEGRLYRRLLADIDPHMLIQGVDRCIKECKFFPTIAEIRDKAGLNTDQNNLAAHVAWEDVEAFADKYSGQERWELSKLRRDEHGELVFVEDEGKTKAVLDFYPNPDADKVRQPRIEYALRAVGGLNIIYLTPKTERHFVERRFIEAYLRYDAAQDYRAERDALQQPAVKQLVGTLAGRKGK
jgi:hypothetical protein